MFRLGLLGPASPVSVSDSGVVDSYYR